MKGRAIGDLRCSSQTAAENVRSDIAAFVAGQTNVFNVDQAPATRNTREDGWHVIFDVRFQSRLEADQLYQRIQNRWNSGPLASSILTGSRVSLHNCSHDEAIGNCLQPGAVFVEAVK